jgi:hypothetical protein
MDWWEDEFCQRLAAGSRYVVRYDHRGHGPVDGRAKAQLALDHSRRVASRR